jgi:hypothetical protein
MSLPWFRVYANDTLGNEKLRTLPEEVQLAWFYLLCIARKCDDLLSDSDQISDGFLPDLDQISFHLRTKKDRAKRILERLESAGLLERSGERLRPYDWEKTQPKSAKTDDSTERARDCRNRKRQQQYNAVGNVCNAIATLHADYDDNQSESESLSEIDLSIDLKGIREALTSAVGAKVAPECTDVSPIEQLVREGC